MPVMSLPASMTTAPSLTDTLPRPLKSAFFQPLRVLPSKRVFQPALSVAPPGGALPGRAAGSPAVSGSPRARTRITLPGPTSVAFRVMLRSSFLGVYLRRNRDGAPTLPAGPAAGKTPGVFLTHEQGSILGPCRSRGSAPPEHGRFQRRTDRM